MNAILFALGVLNALAAIVCAADHFGLVAASALVSSASCFFMASTPTYPRGAP